MTRDWTVQEADSLDGVTAVARRVADAPKEGKQCLMLEVKPRDPVNAPTTLERTLVAIHTSPVQLKPGSLVSDNRPSS